MLNDLEFQLTLQTKLTPPPKPKVTAPAPAPAPVKPAGGHKKSNSAFGRLLTSPKKRKEIERKQQEEAERAERAAALKVQQEREAAKRAKANPTAWDLLHDLVATDGSFARAYICLKNHERQAFGRPFTVDIPCFNEWALEDAEIASSVKSKRGGPVRRPPYKVGKLTLQLLYVPKPKGATDDDMPKSMNACIREMKEAEEARGRVFEGHLSQQGGDCPVSVFPFIPAPNILARNGDILIRLYSTGAAASSGSLARSSRLTTRQLASLVRQSTLPRHPSSSMTAPRCCKTSLVCGASRASPKKMRAMRLSKRVSASASAMARRLTSTRTVRSRSTGGWMCSPRWSARTPCRALPKRGLSWSSRRKRERGRRSALRVSSPVPRPSRKTRRASSPAGSTSPVGSILPGQACMIVEARTAPRTTPSGTTVAANALRRRLTRAPATMPLQLDPGRLPGVVRSSR